MVLRRSLAAVGAGGAVCKTVVKAQPRPSRPRPNRQMRRRCRWLFCFLCIALPAAAQNPTSAAEKAAVARRLRERLQALSLRDFDIRQQPPQAPAAGKAADRKALQDHRAAVRQRKAQLEAYRAAAEDAGRRGLRLAVNAFGLPKLLANAVEPLSAPSTQEPIVIAKNFLRARRDLFLLDENDIAALRLVGRDSSAGGLSLLHFNQSVNGVDVYQGHVQVALNAAGQVVQAGAGSLIPQLQTAAQPALSAREAVAAAFASLGIDPPSTPEPLPSSDARYSWFRNPAGAKTNPVRAELSIFPMTAASARLAWRLFVQTGAMRSYEMLIDAQDGRLLLRRNLTYAVGQARVWKISPLAGGRELVDFPAGWLPPNGVVTTGNNVDAFLDTDGNMEPDTQEFPDTRNGRGHSPGQVFDFPAPEGEGGADPRQFKAAAVTNLFYLINAAHDYFYDLGFTEQAGNFQTDNFGRGGKGNDAVVAVSQAITDNAFYADAPDGMPSYIVMGIFTQGTQAPDDDRDSSYAGQTIVHEYAHGVTTRIVGNSQNPTCLLGTQSAGLGEGWSDYFSSSYTNDPVQGAFLTGNAERGIRRQSYEGYTFTYEDLGNDGFDAPHDEGEIWGAALWDLYKELGQNATDRLVMDGLKLTPCFPDMIDARDGILTALEANPENDAAAREKTWRVFARRGMGYAAGGEDGNESIGTVFTASFDLPPDLQTGNRSPAVSSTPPLGMVGLGQDYVYDIAASDPDGDDVRYALNAGPEGMTVDPVTGVVRWPATFTSRRAKIDVTDGNGGKTIHGFQIYTLTSLTPGQAVTVEGEAFSAGRAVVEVAGETPILQATLRNGKEGMALILLGPDGSQRFAGVAGENGTLSVSAPPAGGWSVGVDSFRAYDGASLQASFPAPAPLGANAQLPDLSGETTSETFYRVVIPPGTASFTISTGGGPGDADLFVKHERAAVCSGPNVFVPAGGVFEDMHGCVYDEASREYGNAERIVIDNPAPGAWFIDLRATEAYSGVTLTTAAALGDARIFFGSVGLATQTPVISSISPGAIVTAYGENFAPAGTSAASPAFDEEGRIATVLAGVCLEINGDRSRMLAVFNHQINAQAPENLPAAGLAEVVVVRNCGAADEHRSPPSRVWVSAHSPGFFNFVNNDNGVNPAAALHGGGPGLVGEPGLLPGAAFTPAAPGETVSFFGTGFGATDPPLAAGEIPLRALPQSNGQARLIDEVSFSIGGIAVPAADVLYAGSVPCCAGLQQFVVKIPENAADGNLPVTAEIGGVSTPAGPYITVKRRQ